MTTAIDALPAHRTRAGFPLDSCHRCGGSGHYSYNSVHGSTCYGCGGSGFKVAKGATNAKGLYDQAFRRETEPLVGHPNALTAKTRACVQVGDTIEFPYRSDKWHVVAAIDIGDREMGWSGADSTPCAWEAHLTFESGETVRTQTSAILRRKIGESWPARRAEFVKQALDGWRKAGCKGGTK